jgi:hypothetical protein
MRGKKAQIGNGKRYLVQLNNRESNPTTSNNIQLTGHRANMMDNYYQRQVVFSQNQWWVSCRKKQIKQQR